MGAKIGRKKKTTNKKKADAESIRVDEGQREGDGALGVDDEDDDAGLESDEDAPEFLLGGTARDGGGVGGAGANVGGAGGRDDLVNADVGVITMKKDDQVTKPSLYELDLDVSGGAFGLVFLVLFFFPGSYPSPIP